MIFQLPSIFYPLFSHFPESFKYPEGEPPWACAAMVRLSTSAVNTVVMRYSVIDLVMAYPPVFGGVVWIARHRACIRPQENCMSAGFWWLVLQTFGEGQAVHEWIGKSDLECAPVGLGGTAGSGVFVFLGG